MMDWKYTKENPLRVVTMEEEIWKPILSGKYEVSNLGQVRMIKTGKILRPYVDKAQEYDRVCLYEEGKRIRRMVHVLIANAFIGPKPEGYEIDHLNTNIHDNRVCNLKYVTREQNRNNPLTRFNHEVARVKRAIASGKKTQEEILRLVKIMKAL